MKLENNIRYKEYGKIDILPIQNSLNSLDPNLWFVDTSRQLGPYTPHKETNSLIVQYCPGEPEIDKTFLTMFPLYKTGKVPISKEYHSDSTRKSTRKSFPQDLKEIQEKMIDKNLNHNTRNIVVDLEKKFDGISGLVVYARLPPNKNISEHSDPGFYLSVIHRLHIPIFTNEKCYFTIDKDSFHMEEGHLYEINNLMSHSVENYGDTDRIHLIIDIIPNSVLKEINFEKL